MGYTWGLQYLTDGYLRLDWYMIECLVNKETLPPAWAELLGGAWSGIWTFVDKEKWHVTAWARAKGSFRDTQREERMVFNVKYLWRESSGIDENRGERHRESPGFPEGGIWALLSKHREPLRGAELCCDVAGALLGSVSLALVQEDGKSDRSSLTQEQNWGSEPRQQRPAWRGGRKWVTLRRSEITWTYERGSCRSQRWVLSFSV